MCKTLSHSKNACQTNKHKNLQREKREREGKVFGNLSFEVCEKNQNFLSERFEIFA